MTFLEINLELLGHQTGSASSLLRPVCGYVLEQSKMSAAGSVWHACHHVPERGAVMYQMYTVKCFEDLAGFE